FESSEIEDASRMFVDLLDEMSDTENKAYAGQLLHSGVLNQIRKLLVNSKDENERNVKTFITHLFHFKEYQSDRSMGRGKMMVEFFSAAMVFSVWR
ncbi:hypothetical protein ACDT12_13700, partial [Staphylococcus aureus]